MTTTTTTTTPIDTQVLAARGLWKRFGKVTALAGADFDLYPGEILAVIGDNGAGKSSLIKVLCGAYQQDAGEVYLDGRQTSFSGPHDARGKGIETVYQTLAVAPGLDISSNLYLGREVRRKGVLGSVFRLLDRKAMDDKARHEMSELGLLTIQDINQAVETLSGGQRQGVAVARSAAFATKLVIMDEPTAALGVRETRKVLDLILSVRERGLPIVLISHNMPNVFEVADRIQIMRLGRRAAVVKPQTHSMSDAVAIMTGAAEPDPEFAG